MIDCENEVFSRVASALQTAYPGINVASEYVRSPSSFPHVSIEMSNCDTLRMLQGQTSTENYVRAVFDINIYSNKTDGKKSECKEIAHTIDEALFKMNFMRIYLKPVPNLEDASIYRIAARYRVATDGKYFYRR